MITAPYMGIINDWRRSLGLQPRSTWANPLVQGDGRPVQVLYPYSPQVVPTPPDWPDTTAVTGYWFLDEGDDWQPPANLQRFLEAGAPPVYVGFGSMAGSDPEAKARVVIEALNASGQRGVLASGWGGLKADALPPHIHILESAPHDWLFPRMAAVVHHGGSGTTAAGLRAGKPTVIAPFTADQPFWGERVYRLGVGTKPIPQRQLNAASLSAAITEAVNNRDMQRCAAALGDAIRAEDGVERAIDFIHAHLPVPA
jgi:sterol 3beta-glucosyltransferase